MRPDDLAAFAVRTALEQVPALNPTTIDDLGRGLPVGESGFNMGKVVNSLLGLDAVPGAIAIGHPFGMTGARLQNTMLNSLTWHDKTTSLISMCVGGGQGMALILERI